MALQPGARLGPYEILAPLGAGGMGEVYRARDTKLGRDVALKVLLPSVASDPDRLARFSREAQVLASLNHPNIAAIYGLEDADGTKALVLELVEGPTLADRLAQGAIPIDETLRMAKQITEALEAAHEAGIVHRDLKPANIKLRVDGTVKVLDFGLAKAMEPAIAPGASAGQAPASMSPTITTPAMTRAGFILGTAAYMSPEQARGTAVDRRSDLWALGVVLYEMLVGRRLFDGATVSDTLASVLTREPDWSTLPPATPAPVRKLLRRCLEKDRKRRLDSAGAARLELEEALGAADSLETMTVAADAVPRRVMRVRMAVAAGATALVAGLLGWILWATPRAQTVVRFAMDVPAGQTFRNRGRPVLAVSPDGRAFVYNTEAGLYLRTMDQVQPRLVSGTAADIASPFFSPDGQWIGFWDRSGGQLKRISVSGGPPVVIASGITPLYGASWGRDGTILVGQAAGIARVPATGGTPELVVKASDGEHIDGPQLLPDGDGVLFAVTTAVGVTRWDQAAIVVQSLHTGQRTVVLRGASAAQYVPPGHLVYATGKTLFAVAFDAKRLRLTSGAVPVVDDVMRALVPNVTTSTANYGVAEDGTLAYVKGTAASVPLTLAWVDRQGRQTTVDAPPRTYIYPRNSPDGSRVVVDTDDQDRDIWSWDLTRRTLSRLTFAPGFDEEPVWAPDGGRVFFSSDRDGPLNLYVQAADGTGTAERLTTTPGTSAQGASGVTPDGTRLIFTELAPGTGANVMQVNVTGTHAVTPLVQTPAAERNGIVSPDGRWLAYEANDSGVFEIYVRPYPDVASARWQVSTGGGTQPLWSRDGRELFFVSPGYALLRVGVAHGASWTATTPTMLLKDGSMIREAGPTNRTYDVSPDGRRFLVVKQAAGPDASPPQFVVVQHFDELLKTLVPAK